MSDDLFTAFLPMMIIGLMILPVALWLCPKMGARRWLWGVFCFIPVVNVLVPALLAARALGAILDRLNEGKEDTA